MAKLVIVEGPDNSGKSTLIERLIEEGMILIDFPKRTESGIFKIESRNAVATFETMLNHLDPSKTYLLDRGYLSNCVYESLRGHDEEQYIVDTIRLMQNHDVKFIPLTRNYLSQDFEDDNIKLNKDQFNDVIDKYHELYKRLWLMPIQYIFHDGKNFVQEVVPIDEIIKRLKLK